MTEFVLGMMLYRLVAERWSDDPEEDFLRHCEGFGIEPTEDRVELFHDLHRIAKFHEGAMPENDVVLEELEELGWKMSFLKEEAKVPG